MKILLAIPSKNRVETLQKYTLKWLRFLPDSIDWFVFVEPQDWTKYGEILSALEIIELPKDNQGLGYAKKYIKEYAIQHGYDFIFKIDDDIKGFTSFRTILSPEDTADKVRGIIAEAMTQFEKYPNLQAVSFPYKFELYSKKEWAKTKRIQTCFIVKTASLYVDSRISVFEDFATGISILANNGTILKYGLSAIDCGVKVGGGTGGHQSFNRREQALKEVEPLRELYPPLKFKKVDKLWGIEPDIRSIKL